MNSRLLQAKVIFEQAIAQGSAADRLACVKAACGGDEALQREVESLLAAHDGAGTFLDAMPAFPAKRATRQGMGGQRVGDYQLLEEVARGGMGIVYKARQVSLNRTVAVKMILAGQLASEVEVKRFKSEAEAAASLNHPNVVGIYEVGEHDGHHYYSMPFVEGRSLAQLVESSQWRPGDGAEAAYLMAKVARAVQHAHEAGILHRDLKPGNILIGLDGEPRVTDFGLAKRVTADGHMTLTGHVLGTPSFMAPEQARGRSGQSTAATDIYSLGAVLYYLLTGRPPFVADSALDALLLVVEAEAVLPRRINPRLPGPLERICLRCLEKRPQDRFASAGELAESLERFLKGELAEIYSKSIGRRLEGWAKRQPALAARLATGVLCLAIVETAYQVHRYTTPAQHWAVVVVLLVWLLISFLCQRGLDRERHPDGVRLFWSIVDQSVLTAVLLISQAVRSPLVILYPTLIAASGFWFRVPLVLASSCLALVGYVILLLDAQRHPITVVPAHWHLLALVAISVTGVAVAYLVNRVGVLARFHAPYPKLGSSPIKSPKP